jgi:hypothetical protein
VGTSEHYSGRNIQTSAFAGFGSLSILDFFNTIGAKRSFEEAMRSEEVSQTDLRAIGSFWASMRPYTSGARHVGARTHPLLDLLAQASDREASGARSGRLLSSPPRRLFEMHGTCQRFDALS